MRALHCSSQMFVTRIPRSPMSPSSLIKYSACMWGIQCGEQNTCSRTLVNIRQSKLSVIKTQMVNTFDLSSFLVCMCLCSYAHNMQRPELILDVVFYYFLPCFLKYGLSLALKLTDLTRLAAKHRSMFHLSQHVQFWDYRHVSPPIFTWILEL